MRAESNWEFDWNAEVDLTEPFDEGYFVWFPEGWLFMIEPPVLKLHTKQSTPRN